MADIPVRKNRSFFFGMTLVISVAIAATVLLANDRRHLNALLDHYNLRPTPAVPLNETLASPGPPRLSAPPGTEVLFSGSGATPFARTMRFPAPQMCKLFSERGFEGGEWQVTGAFGDGSAECSAEKMIGSEQGPDAPLAASLFAIIRGSEHEDITSLRIKMVAPPDEDGDAARKELDGILESLIRETGWSDLTPLRQRIAKLEDRIEMLDTSLSVTFRQEFTNENAYNLIIRPVSTNPDVRQLQRPARTGAFNQ